MGRITTTTDIIYNENAKKDITIIHVSDIHFNKNTKPEKLEKLANYIKKTKPEYIMITGDTLDDPVIVKDNKKIKELINFLTILAENSKVIIALGNHDIQTDEDYRFFEKLNDLYNIYYLNNTAYHDDKIYVFGYTLPNTYYYGVSGGESLDVLLYQLNLINKKLNKVPNKIPKIAMIHSPIKLTNPQVIDKLNKFDIILSGHTHNGMVPGIISKIFKNNIGIISPRKRLFPNNSRGRIDIKIGIKTLTIIINGAITKLSLSSGKILSKLNFVYNASINKIIIRKKRGI